MNSTELKCDVLCQREQKREQEQFDGPVSELRDNKRSNLNSVGHNGDASLPLHLFLGQ